MRAWLEWMPAVGGDPHRPLDRELSIADLVDLTLVDARYSGRNPTDTEGPATPQADEPLLNDEQWTALERRVTTAGAAWHLLANQVQVGPTRLGWLPSLRRPFVRPLVNPDQWDGFPEERERLYDLLSRGQSSTVVLSGDLHSAWFRLLRHRRRHVAHELTCPAVAGESYAFAFRRRTHLPAFVLRAVIMLLNRGIELVELDRHGHLLLDVTATASTRPSSSTNPWNAEPSQSAGAQSTGARSTGARSTGARSRASEQRCHVP
jgi:alkaline phosphatase D